MPNVSIQSDGVNTRVFNDDGKEIKGITSLSLRATAQGAVADVELMFIDISAVNAPARIVGPSGKEVRRIEYADGSVEEFGE